MGYKVLNVHTQLLLMTLTQDEMQECAKELARTVQKIAHTMEEQKSARDQMKTTLSVLQTQQMLLAAVVTNGTEFRNIEVESRILDNGSVEDIRLDTGEIIATRPPYDSERQLLLEHGKES